MHFLRKTAPLLGLTTLAFGLGGSVPAAAAGYTYTTLNDPSASVGNTFTQGGTFATGVNNAGQIVGVYYDAANTEHGFLESGGIYTTLDDPSAIYTNVANGVNNAGQVAGYYQDTSNKYHGFLESGGIYTTLDDPNTINYTDAHGVNDAGLVVGEYAEAINTYHGFLESGGIYTTLDDPSARKGTGPQAFGGGTHASDVNNAGQVVGYYEDTSNKDHGFLEIGGAYTTLNAPGTTVATFANSVNNAGLVAGSYDDATGSHGFLEIGGAYTTLNDPSANIGTTYADGVNDAGQVVGHYQDATGYHGFLATPNASPVPEASTTVSFGLLLALGLGATVIAAKRKKARAAA